jgi:hypothetical protein
MMKLTFFNPLKTIHSALILHPTNPNINISTAIHKTMSTVHATAASSIAANTLKRRREIERQKKSPKNSTWSSDIIIIIPMRPILTE